MHQHSRIQISRFRSACISIMTYDAQDAKVIPEVGMRGRAACRTRMEPQKLVSNVSIICRRSLFTVAPTNWFPAVHFAEALFQMPHTGGMQHLGLWPEIHEYHRQC